MALLELKNVNVRYIMKDKKVHACQHVSLEIEEQDSIGIVGESGSGKSTLASAVLRLLPHRITQVDGEILYNGKDLLKLTKDEMDALRWTDLSIVFQKSMSALSPVHKVGAQMEDVYRVHFPNADKNEIKQRVYDLFKVVNLSDRVYELYPHELSGGMMQRVSIALSLLHNPRLLVLDEAT
ncbi:ATP-binding cassette domain-containing protein, partial [Holdemania filiformis]